MSEKKKLRETKVGRFLMEKAPGILHTVGDVLPDRGVLGIVKNLISKEANLSAEDKEYALKLLEAEQVEMQEITKRWESDNQQESWLPRNIRPLVLAAMTLMLFVFMALDSVEINFEIKDKWIGLYEWVYSTAIIAYFGSRTVDKYSAKKFK